MIAYHFTWKYEMGVELHQIRGYLDAANRSHLDQDADSASAWLERFLDDAFRSMERPGVSAALYPGSGSDRFSRKLYLRAHGPGLRYSSIFGGSSGCTDALFCGSSLEKEVLPASGQTALHRLRPLSGAFDRFSGILGFLFRVRTASR